MLLLQIQKAESSSCLELLCLPSVNNKTSAQVGVLRFKQRLLSGPSNAQNNQKGSCTFDDPSLLLPELIKAESSGLLRFFQEPGVGDASFDPSCHEAGSENSFSERCPTPSPRQAAAPRAEHSVGCVQPQEKPAKNNPQQQIHLTGWQWQGRRELISEGTIKLQSEIYPTDCITYPHKMLLVCGTHNIPGNARYSCICYVIKTQTYKNTATASNSERIHLLTEMQIR